MPPKAKITKEMIPDVAFDIVQREVYQKADEYHTNYIVNMENDYGNPMLAIGVNYIKFAIEERNLWGCLCYEGRVK